MYSVLQVGLFLLLGFFLVHCTPSDYVVFWKRAYAIGMGTGVTFNNRHHICKKSPNRNDHIRRSAPRTYSIWTLTWCSKLNLHSPAKLVRCLSHIAGTCDWILETLYGQMFVDNWPAHTDVGLSQTVATKLGAHNRMYNFSSLELRGPDLFHHDNTRGNKLRSMRIHGLPRLEWQNPSILHRTLAWTRLDPFGMIWNADCWQLYTGLHFSFGSVL